MLKRWVSSPVRRLLSVSLVVCLVTSGCATAEYEEQFQRSLRAKGDEAKFKVLHPEQFAITTDSALSMRIPEIFPKEVLTETTHPPEVAKPPFLLDYPGFLFSYQGTPPSEPSKPYSLYLGAVERQAATANVLPDLMQERLRTIDPAATWQDVSVTSPTGEQVQYRKLRAVGAMPFANMPQRGVFEMYLFDGGGYRLFVSWRWPEDIGSQLNMENLIQLSLGTLQVQEAAG